MMTLLANIEIVYTNTKNRIFSNFRNRQGWRVARVQFLKDHSTRDHNRIYDAIIIEKIRLNYLKFL